MSKTQGMNRLSRRGALRILGAAMAVPAGVLGLRELAGAPLAVHWSGEALGAVAGLTLWHRDPAVARRTIERMRVEIARLEKVFSLYDQDSELARLNRDGRLSQPSRDLREVLDESSVIVAASDGAFDPTIQPLWTAYAASGTPDRAALDAARVLVGFDGVLSDRASVGYARPGMGMSLNGIAQGYITDRVTDLLRNEGFDHAMVELGETRALGAAPDGQPFTVRLVDPRDPLRTDRSVALADRALSVSGGYGYRFSTDAHHIFDPRTGTSANRLLDVAVTAPKAIWADALSTAIFVAGEAAAKKILAAYPSATAQVTRADGTASGLLA